MPDPISTGLGVFAESAIDTATFGILQPDIIPAEQEAQYRWATTIGRVTGSIAGMATPGIGSLATSSKAVAGMFKMTKWGSRILKEAEVAGKLGGVGARIIGKPLFSNVVLDTAIFSLHDSARELVTQVRESDPDLTDLGIAALKGAGMGATMGYIGNAVHHLPWYTQGASMMTTMALTDAIIAASEGEDITGEAYLRERLPVSAITGFVLGAMAGSESTSVKKSYRERGAKELETFWREIGIMKEDGTLTVGSMVERMRANGLIAKSAKIDDIPKEVTEAMHSLLTMSRTLGSVGEITPKVFKSLRAGLRQAETGLGIKQPKKGEAPLSVGEKTHAEYIKSITGKETTKGLSKDDWQLVVDDLYGLVNAQVEPILGTKVRPMGGIESNIKSFEQLVTDIGLTDVSDVWALVTANNFRNAEIARASLTVRSMALDIKDAMKEAGVLPKATAAQQVFKGGNPEWKAVAWRALDNAEAFAALPAPVQAKVKSFRDLLDLFHQRLNISERAMGVPEAELTAYREFYARHSIDTVAAKKAGMDVKWLRPEQAFNRYMAKEQTASTQKARSAHDYPLKEDIVATTLNAINNDTMAVWLHEPTKIVLSQLDELEKVGVLTGADKQNLHTIIKEVFYNIPTPMDAKNTARIRHFLETNRVGQAIDSMATKLGVDLGGSPLTAMSSAWGKLVTTSYMFGRPKQWLRNSTQASFELNFASTKNFVKGLFAPDTPFFEEYSRTSSFMQATRGVAEEHTTFLNPIMEMGTAPYGSSQTWSARVMAKTQMYQMMDYMTLPQYAKPRNQGGVGFADPAGVRIRAEAKAKGDPNWRNYFTETEKGYIHKAMDESVRRHAFMYTATGLPLYYRSRTMSPVTKLTSFPMNAMTTYLTDTAYTVMHGKPQWAAKLDVKLPSTVRYGALKGLVAFSVLAGAAEQLTGTDWRSNMLVGYTPEHGVTTGILELRPSPAVSLVNAVIGLMSDDPRVKAEAKRTLKYSIPSPGYSMVRDVGTALEEGSAKNLLFYKASSRQRKNPYAKVFASRS